MSATSRELVYQTLACAGPARAPRQLWVLPWAQERWPQETDDIVREFPADIVAVAGHEKEPLRESGNRYGPGQYIDSWGCVFENIGTGHIGEVKDPQIKDWGEDAPRVRFPLEMLTIDIDAVNRDCARSELFLLSNCCARPFEQIQFLRGTENLYIDLADPPREMLHFLNRMHELYCGVVEIWAKTDVDAIHFMDDWGSQRSLLIRPEIWREIFKPLYRDYCQIARSAGKKVFFHTDGHVLSIIPDLMEIGVDAVNSQIFCMGVDNLQPYAGRITFWGEIDRQQILPYASTQEVDQAVRSVHKALWRDGGCIAQCEMGVGAMPANVRQVFLSWDRVISQ